MKGRALQRQADSIEAKYKLPVKELIAADPPLMTHDEVTTILKSIDKFYNKQNQSIRQANQQIASTKRILGIPDAVGVLFLIFDRVPGMMAEIIRQRGQRDLQSLSDGEPTFKHVDLVMFSCRMKDMTIHSYQTTNGYCVRGWENEEHVRMARGILDALKGNFKDPGPRLRSIKYEPDDVQIWSKDIFAEPLEL